MSWEHIHTETVKARKAHLCIWCGGFILKGDSYVRMCGKYEGEFQFSKYHPECEAACRRFFAENSDEDSFEPYAFKRGTTEER